MKAKFLNFIYFFVSILKINNKRNLINKGKYFQNKIYINYKKGVVDFDSFNKLISSIFTKYSNPNISINVINFKSKKNIPSNIEDLFSILHMHMIYYDINFIKNARIPNNFVLKNGIYYSNKIMVKTKLFPRNIYTERKMHHFLKNLSYGKKCIILYAKRMNNLSNYIKKINEMYDDVIFISYYNTNYPIENYYPVEEFNFTMLQKLFLIKVSDGFLGSKSIFREFAKHHNVKLYN